jgi:hypothetical protein
METRVSAEANERANDPKKSKNMPVCGGLKGRSGLLFVFGVRWAVLCFTPKQGG